MRTRFEIRSPISKGSHGRLRISRKDQPTAVRLLRCRGHQPGASDDLASAIGLGREQRRIDPSLRPCRHPGLSPGTWLWQTGSGHRPDGQARRGERSNRPAWNIQRVVRGSGAWSRPLEDHLPQRRSASCRSISRFRVGKQAIGRRDRFEKRKANALDPHRCRGRKPGPAERFTFPADATAPDQVRGARGLDRSYRSQREVFGSADRSSFVRGPPSG
jgi:hypothetical protein